MFDKIRRYVKHVAILTENCGWGCRGPVCTARGRGLKWEQVVDTTVMQAVGSNWGRH
jgi:hypothetical protein